MLFKTITEVRKFLSIIDKKITFEYLEPDLDNAQWELGKIVGEGVISLAQSIYDNDEASGSGDGAEFNSAEFVERVQAAIVVMAYRDFAINNDVSHELTGRKAIVDGGNQKQAWEFMIDRDNAGLTNRMHKAINRLIDFMNKTKPVAWTDSIIYRDTFSVLLSDISLFQRYYHIDDSQLLFTKLLPFQRTAQNNHIIPIVGKGRFTALRADIKENGLRDEDTAMLVDLIGPALAYRTMAEGIKIFSVKLLPEGLVQQFASSIQMRSSSMPVPGREKDFIVAYLNKKVEEFEFNLARYITGLDEASGTGDVESNEFTSVVERNSSDNQFFTV
jgi:hypothetical protein